MNPILITDEKPASNDSFEALAIAIVKQAAEDYRALGIRLLDCDDPEEEKQIRKSMKELSRFFLGEWCCQLTGSDAGPQILELLDREVFGE